MKINVKTVVLDYENKPFMDRDKELSWKEVIYQALNAYIEGEKMLAEDKNKSYQITLKCYQTDQPDLTLDDRNFIVERIKKMYNPLVCGRAQEYFDKPEPEIKEQG